jgi:sugar/nucleoside kinase (ribokinase family)
VAASRLGARCAYAGVLGPRSHEDSEFVLQTLRREHVDVRHVARRASARPVRSEIVVESTRGTRTIFYDTTGVVGAGSAHPPRGVIASSRVLVGDRFGLGGMLRAARLARAAGRPVVGDFESTETPRLSELLSCVNHLIVPRVTAHRLTGRRHPGAAAAGLRARGHEVVVVTCGGEGCWVAGGDGRPAVHAPAFVVDVVDTTGCGDVFHGAYAAALARELGLRDRVRLASAAAALKATRSGGQSGCPTMTAVRALMGQRGG